MDAADGEEDEDEESRERGGVEERVLKEGGDVAPALFIQRRHAGVTTK